MSSKASIEALDLLKEALKELESKNGSILSGVQKLSRASKVVGDEDTFLWCEIQLGNIDYTSCLLEYREVLSAYFKKRSNNEDTSDAESKIDELEVKLKKLGRMKKPILT